MEEKKYYTPTIDEFHEGFEFEVNNAPSLSDEWTPVKISGLRWFPSDAQLLSLKIRVKHLDKEDIESLGWRESHFSNNNHFYFEIMEGEEKKCVFQLQLAGDNICIIDSYNENGRQLPSFQGWIKNKSRLRLVMQMVGII